MSKNVVIIGAGFAGLSAASQLAQKGYKVSILEKNDSIGGRARQFEASGFIFDMGPSWYWMPDVFEAYFARFGKKVSDYYDLVRLSPSYQIVFAQDESIAIPANLEELFHLFEAHEKGSSEKLKQFLDEAAYKYEVGMKEFVYKPSISIREFMDFRVFKSLFGLQMLTSMESYVNKYFKHEHLRQLLKFPVLFLGATPQETPAMYSLMNYADLALGTWYPMGGMFKIIEAMGKLAEELGVKIYTNHAVTQVEIQDNSIKKVISTQGIFEADIVIGAADYRHLDQEILGKAYSNYSAEYWDKRTLAPSSLLYYVGVNKKLPKLLHHNLFFDEDFNVHAQEIYKNPQWPNKPLFYACVPSKTDNTVAPENHENLFLLIPVAPDLQDTEKERDFYFEFILQKLEAYTGENIRAHIIYKRSFAHQDFIKDYNAFKGNAYGLANTLKQTAFLKPKLKHKKIQNLYFAGQLTTPGPGMPPAIISGLVAADEIMKKFPIQAPNYAH